MTNYFHDSLNYAAFNLDLRRPNTAARHLRVAIRILCRLKDPCSSFPSECRPWLNRSLYALKHADYTKAAAWLREALDRIPENDSNQALMSQLRRLEFSLLKGGLLDAADCIRAVSDSVHDIRSRNEHWRAARSNAG